MTSPQSPISLGLEPLSEQVSPLASYLPSSEREIKADYAGEAERLPSLPTFVVGQGQVVNSSIDELIQIIQKNSAIISNDIQPLLNKITEALRERPDIATKIANELRQLFDADEELMDLFKQIIRLFKNDTELVKNIQALNYQLFDLQIKIIFDRCYKLIQTIESLKVSVTDIRQQNTVLINENKNLLNKLLIAFRGKTEAMNKLLASQDESFEGARAGLGQLAQDAKRVASIPVLPESPKPSLAEEKRSALTSSGIFSNIASDDVWDDTYGLDETVIGFQNPPEIMNYFNQVFGKTIGSPVGSSSSAQVGGRDYTPDEIAQIRRQFINIVNQSMKKYYIFNSSIMLKLITVMYDPEMFIKCLQDMTQQKDNPEAIITTFFFIFNEKSLDILTDKNILDKKDVDRDTKLFSLYFTLPSGQKAIFLYKLLRKIYSLDSGGIDRLFSNIESSKMIFSIFKYLDNKLNEIQKLYRILYPLSSQIEACYTDYIEQNKKILSYVKIRQDTQARNPLFATKIYKNKYLFVKYHNKGKHTTSNEYYYFGPYDGIFTTNDNKDIADSPQVRKIVDKLLRNESVCVVGYGQSGAGKTSSLIYFSGKQPQDGILMEICRKREITNKFDHIILRMKEIRVYYNNNINRPSQIRKEHYNVQDLKIDEKETHYKFIKDDRLGWIYEGDSKKEEYEKRTMGKFITDGFDKRKIEPTPNNPVSSRSHVVVDIGFYTKSDTKEADVHLIICDLAGVENVFKCDEAREVERFDNSYKISDKYKNKDAKIIFETDACEQKLFEGDNKQYSNNYTQGVQQLINYNNASQIIEQQKGGACLPAESGTAFACDNSTKFSDVHNMIEGKIESDIKELILDLLYTVNKIIVNFKSIKDSNASTMRSNVITWLDQGRPTNIIQLAKGIGDYSINQFDYQYVTNFLQRVGVNNVTVLSPDVLKEYRKTIKRKLVDLMCDHVRIKKIKHNCRLRINEGYMINKSLEDMRSDLKKIVLHSIKKNNNFNPLVYASPQISYCANINIESDNYNSFYEDAGIFRTDGQIMEVLSSFGMNVTALTFVIFTVINISKNVNNPPNTPYINTNEVKYYFYVYNDPDKEIKLRTSLLKLSINLTDQDYYVINYKGPSDKNAIKELMRTTTTDNINNINISFDNVKFVIDEIDKINAVTLLGSLEASQKVSSLQDNSFVCSYQKDLQKILNEYKQQTLYLPQFEDNLDVDTINKFIDRQEADKDYMLRL